MENAQRIAAERNAETATPEALAEAEGWEARVAEWLSSDTAAFLPLIHKRFPEWREHLVYETVEYQGGSRQITIPSANPRVEEPLTLCVAVNEVLIAWVDAWHEHIYREEGCGQDDKSHLSRACAEIADLIEERIRTGTVYEDVRLSRGSTLYADEEFPDDWKGRRLPWNDGRPVSIIARSWRGTYDEEWHSGKKS